MDRGGVSVTGSMGTAEPLRRASSSIRLREIALLIPRGRILPENIWNRRHRVIIWLLWAHAIALTIFGTIRNHGLAHSALDCGILALAAICASSPKLSRRTRSTVATLGVLTSSALLVHFADGAIEAHFHYFVMLGLVSLYQDWVPYLLAVGFVLVDHTLYGVLYPEAVFSHPQAVASPLKWAAIHAFFVAGACLVNIVYWRASEEMMLRDSLTDLVNATMLTDRINRGLASQARTGSTLGVLFVDLDGFKGVNDRLGHAAGDRLLVGVARRLESCVRPTDLVGRLGGDEFGIVLDPIAEPRDAARVAERILECLRDPFALPGGEALIDASVGVALALPDTEVSAREIVNRADAAMYLAKNKGRGRFEIFDPSIHARIVDRIELEEDLAGAMLRDELKLVYQPIIDLSTGKVVAMEALLRWEMPSRGVISPLEFIPIAEKTGAILDIGRWVLERATYDTTKLQRALAEPISVNVNLSALQLESDRLLEDVRHALRTSGLVPERLTLELTESALMRDRVVALRRMQALKALGVSFAIDDFGTGYSALSYLQKFPVDCIKIDRSFIDELGQSDSATLAEAIVSLASSLRLVTVAEGIETPRQRDLLTDLGADQGQGFLFARPMELDALEAMLVDRGGTRPIVLADGPSYA